MVSTLIWSHLGKSLFILRSVKHRLGHTRTFPNGIKDKKIRSAFNSGRIVLLNGISAEQAPDIAQETPGRTDLDWATLFYRHRLTDRSLHARFNAHAARTQVVGEVFSRLVQRV